MVVSSDTIVIFLAMLRSQRHFQVADRTVFVLDKDYNILISITQIIIKLVFSCFFNSVHFDLFGCSDTCFTIKICINLFNFDHIALCRLTLNRDSSLISEVEWCLTYCIAIKWDFCSIWTLMSSFGNIFPGFSFIMCREWRHCIGHSTNLFSSQVRCSLSCSCIIVPHSWWIWLLFFLVRWRLEFLDTIILILFIILGCFLSCSCLDLLLDHLERFHSLLFFLCCIWVCLYDSWLIYASVGLIFTWQYWLYPSSIPWLWLTLQVIVNPLRFILKN